MHLHEIGFKYVNPPISPTATTFTWYNGISRDRIHDHIGLALRSKTTDIEEKLSSCDAIRYKPLVNFYVYVDEGEQELIAAWKDAYFLKEHVTKQAFPGLETAWLHHPASSVKEWHMPLFIEHWPDPIPQRDQERLREFQQLSLEEQVQLRDSYEERSGIFSGYWSILWIFIGISLLAIPFAIYSKRYPAIPKTTSDQPRRR